MNGHWWNTSIVATWMLIVCLAGCGRTAMGPPATAPEVAVVEIQPQQVVLTTELPGRTSPYRIAEIRPQVSGLIQNRLFTEGAMVAEKTLLYKIDPAPYQAAVDNATANLHSAEQATKRAEAALNAGLAALERYEAVLALAKTNFKRFETLIKQNAVSAMEYDQGAVDVNIANAGLRTAKAQVESDRQGVEVAKAAVKQAEAALKTANINLDYTKITSPISGRIGRSNVTDGQIATAYQAVPLATVQQMDPIYVDVTQSTAELLRLKRRLANGKLTVKGSDKVKIVLVGDGTVYPQLGSLQFCDVTVDQSMESVVLRIVVPNPEGTLLPGMYVKAIIEEGVHQQAILVPQQAVVRDPKGNPFALVVDGEDKVQKRDLSTDRAMGDKWLVSAGLAKGDRVIVEGMQKVRPGMPVTVAQPEAAGAAAASPKDVAQTSSP
jgi:membrane fusion protein, multidrug efflux system